MFMMEKTVENLNEHKNGFTKLILKENMIVTVLDLSRSNLNNLDNIYFPQSLLELNLSNNELGCIPTPVLDLKSIKILNLSYNNIKFFDEKPAFCHTIEILNLANNRLCGPPYWVWSENPMSLKEMDLSCNGNIRKSLNIEYFRDLLRYRISVSVIKMRSCALNSHYELLETFENAKTLDLSSEAIITANYFSSIPCTGLDKCCKLERLNLSHTYVTLINPNIDIYVNLTELNLSENRLSSLPHEFCNLINLEICILSFNFIMYLPDNILKLKKLKELSLDGNKLCMLPENMCELENLVKLDIYDNYLYDAPPYMEWIQELDLAQNYFDEPEDEEYIVKKMKVRLKLEARIDGRKFEIHRPESPHSSNSINEELADIDYSNSLEETSDVISRPPSSPEDWDSDEYWVPHFPCTSIAPQSPWLFFVKRKMAEGNFCPMDAHTVSVAEKVLYDKLYHPNSLHESVGQFDDYSSDDS